MNDKPKCVGCGPRRSGLALRHRVCALCSRRLGRQVLLDLSWVPTEYTSLDADDACTRLYLQAAPFETNVATAVNITPGKRYRILVVEE